MRFRVQHRTTYSYDEPVTDSVGIAYLVPRSLPWQEVASSEVVVSPSPTDLAREVDYHGNTATYFQVSEPHTTLEVDGRSEVEVGLRVLPDEALATPWERARPLLDPGLPGAWEVTDFALPSASVPLHEEARAYAAESLAPGRALGEAATELMSRIHRDFRYDHTATTVTSTIADIFDQRAGVCQDFAHLTLSCLRAHGIAARYVSGYLATEPPPGKERVVGADASHAWVEVWLPSPVAEPYGAGWLAIDPTNDQWAGDRYVTVAWGRDYSDVPPVKGVIVTEAKRSTLRVEVDVAPV